MTDIKKEPTDRTDPTDTTDIKTTAPEPAPPPAPAAFVPEAPAVIIADPSGSKASNEVAKHVLAPEYTELYPDLTQFATLVVNPLDPSIPDDQKIVVFQRYVFDTDYYSDVWFKGAAVPMLDGPNKGHTAFQIAVVQKVSDRDSRGRAFWVINPVYTDNNDIQLAKDAMKEYIMRPVDGMRVQVQAKMKEAINRARIDAKMGKDVEMPWFICSFSTGAKVANWAKRSLRAAVAGWKHK
jgi:hypothetical protein